MQDIEAAPTAHDAGLLRQEAADDHGQDCTRVRGGWQRPLLHGLSEGAGPAAGEAPQQLNIQVVERQQVWRAGNS